MQSVWLFLAAVSGVLTLKFSFFSGNMLDTNQSKVFESLTAAMWIPLLILTVALVSGILIDIFLYKNRKLQLRITLLAILVSLVNIFLYYRETKKFVEGKYDLTAIFALAIPILLILAARGIYKDQKLVKSLDRLR